MISITAHGMASATIEVAHGLPGHAGQAKHQERQCGNDRTVPRHGYRFTGNLIAAARSASVAHVGPGTTVSSASNLPIPIGELIGRKADLPRIVEQQTSHRLLTLTGPGAIGKTSRAFAAAWRGLPSLWRR